MPEPVRGITTKSLGFIRPISLRMPSAAGATAEVGST
ncbi:MAG: hypothetical protein PWP05_1084, partial [Thermovirga sp.]|nr:hypothetical protein [Thermovirga sp.]